MFNFGKFVDAALKGLQEDTSSSAIGYLPGGFLKAKKALGPLARTKKEWGVKVVEVGEGYTVKFEDVLEFGIPDKKTYEEFNKNVVNVHGMTTVDLNPMLQEALTDYKATAKNDLDFVLSKTLSNIEVVSNTIDLINAWYKSFPDSKPSVNLGCAISVSKFSRDIGLILQKLEAQQRIGDMQLITTAIMDKTPLDAITYFKGMKYLIGDSIASNYEGVDLEFRCYTDLTFRTQQLIIIDNDEVCAEMEYYKNLRVVNNMLYPVSGRFNSATFENLKDVITEVVGR